MKLDVTKLIVMQLRYPQGKFIFFTGESMHE